MVTKAGLVQNPGSIVRGDLGLITGYMTDYSTTLYLTLKEMIMYTL
jgi:hypothetical protein